jgi:hypothetical protein
MKNLIHNLAIMVSLTTGVCCAQASLPEGRSLLAGAAMVDITPSPSDLAQPTDSIRDHLFARAIVVASQGTCAALIGLDQGAVRLDMYNSAVKRIVAATGCPTENILISATHTHSGSTNGFGGAPSSDKVADAIVKATDAKAKLAPATLGYGRTNVDMNVNRDPLQ